MAHKPSLSKRFGRKIIDVFKYLDWDVQSIAKVILIIAIPVFLTLGILSIRDHKSIWYILFQFHIAIAAGIHLGIYTRNSIGYSDYITTLVSFGIQIILNHFIFFGALFKLEVIWRVLIGIVLKITSYWASYHIIDN